MAVKFSLDKIVAYTTLFIIIVIGLPLFIVCIYKFYKQYNETYYIRRRRVLIVISTILFCIFLLIESPFYQILILKYGSLELVPHKYILYSSVFKSFYYANGLIYSLRVWLLYFDHKYHEELNKHQWKLLINPSEIQSWFITNRSIYGNTTVLYKGIVILWLILSLIHLDIALLTINTSYFYISIWCFLFFIWVIAVIFISIVWRKFPKTDEFEIKSELKMFLIAYVIISICGLFVLCVLILITLGTYSNMDINFSFLMFLITVFMHMVGIYTNTLLPQLLMKEKKTQLKLLQQNQIQLNVKQMFEQFENLTLKNILNNEYGFNAFMNHLSVEFSSENLLFVVEYLQFKRGIIELFGDDLHYVDGADIHNDITVPYSLPKSLIVSTFEKNVNKTNVDNKYKIFVEAVIQLYNKYISAQAKHEINISYKTRKKFDNIFNYNSTGNDDIYMQILSKNEMDYKKLEEYNPLIIVLNSALNYRITKSITVLLPLLHECCLQTTNLMIDAFFRFQHTSTASDLYRRMSHV